MDLTGLLVERVVVHQIPRKEPKVTAEQQEPLVLSEAVSPLPDSLRAYMNMRLLGSLQSAEKAFDVVFDDDADTPIPLQLRAYLAAEATGAGTGDGRDQTLVNLSRDIAELLFELQPPQPPTGLLVVCSGTIGNAPFVAVMKLEHEKGVTVDETNVGGRRTFEMTVEESLVLVAGTKVFKAAAFKPSDGADPIGSPDDFECDARLSDTQNPFTASGMAAYFARDLLGVKLEAEPRVLTEQVFKSVEQFINAEIADPASRVAAERALLTEMSANKQTFSAQTFGNQHLEADERKALRDHLKDEGLPTQAFPKDLELIQGRLKMMALELDGNITVVAPQERFDDDTISVTGDEAAGSDAVITIRAGLRRTHSRGSRGR